MFVKREVSNHTNIINQRVEGEQSKWMLFDRIGQSPGMGKKVMIMHFMKCHC